MKPSKLSETATEKLIKQKKFLTGVLIGFSTVIVIGYSILIYLMFKNHDFKLSTIIPLGFVSFLPMVIRLGQINNELKIRKQ